MIEKDIDFFSEEVFESITLKIPKLTIKGVNKDLIVLTVYRQPGHEMLPTRQNVFRIVPKCLKMSQNVKKCQKMSKPIMGENGRK